MKKFRYIFRILFFITTVLSAQTENNYTETEIVLNHKNTKLFGSLCLPKNTNNKVPIVLIISGSGPTDRNGNSMMGVNNSLKYLAQNLAEKGIASIRYDKRGIGESILPDFNESKLTFDLYIQDANDWINLIRNDKRFNSIIVAGHSEGSLIGMLASKQNVDKFISIAGAGESIDHILKSQLNKLPEQLKNESYATIDSLKNGNIVNNVNPQLTALFRKSVQPYLISWMKYNPSNEINNLDIPYLVVQGDMDIQVSTENAKMLSPTSAIIIHGMNHILKNVISKEDLTSYSNPDLPINQELIDVITTFIQKKP